jgi:hypothetical protein
METTKRVLIVGGVLLLLQITSMLGILVSKVVEERFTLTRNPAVASAPEPLPPPKAPVKAPEVVAELQAVAPRGDGFRPIEVIRIPE